MANGIGPEGMKIQKPTGWPEAETNVIVILFDPGPHFRVRVDTTGPAEPFAANSDSNLADSIKFPAKLRGLGPVFG